MALGIPAVSYQPFEETSFGYGSNEIATAYSTEFPNSTDIVRVTIEHTTGNWDETGHLATPSIGTAVATYHKQQEYWTVKGERDDVDAVLAAMSFFPADKEETRLWDPTDNALKDNQTSGTYTDEEPPTIGNTTFTLRVYDGGTSIATETVTFSVTEAVYGNQRPYWTVAPTAEDLNSASHDAVAGGLLDLGTISHGTDTENVQVKCEFRTYGDDAPYPGEAFGVITTDANIFIGDKKPAASNLTDARFDFTGSVAEANAFLDNVRYYGAANSQTFDMFLTVTDGVVGSTLTKTCWFSDAVLTASNINDQHYVEDANPAYWTFGNMAFGDDDMPEVTTFTATITLDADGRANCTSFDTSIAVDSQSYTSGTGVLLITETSLTQFKSALKNLRFTPVADYSGSFGMTVDFTFSNPTLGTSYSATQQNLTVTGQEVAEVSNLNSTHVWTEDRRYDFKFGDYPEIIHGYNHDFDIVFTLNELDGVNHIWIHGDEGFFRDISEGVYKLSGTRNEVNVALSNLFMVPNADYAGNFTISFTVDRTSGDLTHETQSTGTITMNAVEVSEFSFPITQPIVNWENNKTTIFASELSITDLSSFLYGPTFGTTYTLVARLRQDNNAFANGVLTLSQYEDRLDNVTGDFTNELTITGIASNINLNMQELEFVPAPGFENTNDFYVDYKLTRDADNVVLTDFSPSYHTLFKNPTITAPYSINRQLFDWTEDIPLEFDTKFRITENITANSYYTAANGYTDWYGSKYRVTLNGSQGATLPEIKFATTHTNLDTISGVGTYADPLILEGYRDEINQAFATMKMTPTVLDFTTSALDNGGFWLQGQVKRLRDNSVTLDYNERIADFNAGTDTSEYRTIWTNVKYTEDIPNQYLFAHIDDFIQDGAGDLFDATYEVTIALANEVTGKFVPYVEEGYLDEDFELFISDYEVRIVGSKAEVNASIHDIIFTPYADVSANVDIIYTQERRYNNTTVTHADAVTVATMIGIDTPEFIYGTANNNIQYFVADEHINGVDTTKTREEILAEDADVILTPKQISLNLGLPYDRPITVTDTYEDGGESLYKITFDGGTLFDAYLRASLNVVDTGWQTREELNNVMDNGIYPINVIEHHPASFNNGDAPHNYFKSHTVYGSNGTSYENVTHDTQYTANFEVHRRAASGVDAIIKTGSLTYQFQTGLQLWSRESILTNNEFNSQPERFDYIIRRLDKDSTVGVRWEQTNNNNTQVTTRSSSPYHVDTSTINYTEPSDVLLVTDGCGHGHASSFERYFNVNMSVIATEEVDGVVSNKVTQPSPGISNIYPRFKMYQADRLPYSGGSLTNTHQTRISTTGRWFFATAVESATKEYQETIKLKIWTDWGVLITEGRDYDITLRSITDSGTATNRPTGGNINP